LHIPFFLVFFFFVISVLLSEMQNLRSCPAQCGTVRPAATEVFGVDIRNVGDTVPERMVCPRANIVAQVRRIVQGPVVQVGRTLCTGKKIPQVRTYRPAARWNMMKPDGGLHCQGYKSRPSYICALFLVVL
jgi:hypothetical protein